MQKYAFVLERLNSQIGEHLIEELNKYVEVTADDISVYCDNIERVGTEIKFAVFPSHQLVEFEGTAICLSTTSLFLAKNFPGIKKLAIYFYDLDWTFYDFQASALYNMYSETFLIAPNKTYKDMIHSNWGFDVTVIENLNVGEICQTLSKNA